MDLQKHIYLDNMATTPVDTIVIDVMLPFYFDKYGNPGSNNFLGKLSSNAIVRSKKNILKNLNTPKSKVIFHSCATESITTVFKSLDDNYERQHIITQKTEHKAVIENCKALEEKGWDISYLDVDVNGNICIEDLKNSIREKTKLIAIMQVNNEIGTLHPIDEISNIATENNILFLVDGSQGFGKDERNINFSKIDYYTISSHKIYGPKGIAALICSRKGISELTPLIKGGNQEDGFRSGTPNVPGIVGLAKAIELVKKNETEISRISRYRKLFLKILDKNFIKYNLNTPLENSVPHNLNIHFCGISNSKLQNNIFELVSFSVGSACSEGEQSYVLESTNKNECHISESIRIGFGRFTTKEEVYIAANILIESIKQIIKNTEYVNS